MSDNPDAQKAMTPPSDTAAPGVRRYSVRTVVFNDELAPYGSMLPNEQGKWVELSDYLALQARYEALEGACWKMREALQQLALCGTPDFMAVREVARAALGEKHE